MVSTTPASVPGMMPVVPNNIPVQPAVSSAPGSGAATPAAPSMDWAVPQMTRTKYLATFQQTDRARTGFIAGVQARNILLQNGLAQIWSLSDYDNDGRLSSEEFLLAGHLC